jgi:hypothetical protein
MLEVHVLAIDLAKRSFQLCGADRGGACVDAPDLASDFFSDILARRFYRSCVRPLVVACCAPRAGMQFEEQGPHRFRELFWLEPRDWLSPF